MTTATLETQMTAPLPYEPPGRGVWALDVDHQSRPAWPADAGAVRTELRGRLRDCFARYGMPLDRLEGRHVNGWFYFRAVPAGAPDTGTAPPPAPVLKVLVRLAPGLRRRRRTAEATIADARWLGDARRWADERTAWIGRTDDLLSVDLAAIGDDLLDEQVRLALTLAGDMIRRHFDHVGVSVAVGRLIVAGRRWGLTPADLVPALRGSSPSSSASRAPLVELAALSADRHDLRTADDLRSVSARAAELVDRYLSSFGWRPLAADVEAPTLAEQPDRLLDLVRSHRPLATPSTPPAPSPSTNCAGACRPPTEPRSISSSTRPASATHRSTTMPASWRRRSGRSRGVLEVGRRGQVRGALTRFDDVFNLTPSELLILAAGGSPVPARCSTNVDTSGPARSNNSRRG